MQRLGLFLTGLMMLVILPLAGCGSGNGDVGAVLGYEFPLKLGQKAVLFGDGLEIKFVEVLEDSRCPDGATCIWEGRISCRMELVKEGEQYQMVLIQPGLSDDYVEQTYQEYMLNFKVIPYPHVDTEIKKEDYRLLLTVDRP